jgi:hypothetical protein
MAYRWYQKILYIEDVHVPVVVSLSGDDVIVPTEALARHLEVHAEKAEFQGRIDVVNWEGAMHGEILLRPSMQAELDRRMRQQEERMYGKAF